MPRPRRGRAYGVTLSRQNGGSRLGEPGRVGACSASTRNGRLPRPMLSEAKSGGRCAAARYSRLRSRPEERSSARIGTTTRVGHLTRFAMTRSGAEGSRRSSNSASARRRAAEAPAALPDWAASIASARRHERHRHPPWLFAHPVGSAWSWNAGANLALTPQRPHVHALTIAHRGRVDRLRRRSRTRTTRRGARLRCALEARRCLAARPRVNARAFASVIS